jgi:four helix bundle protein
VATITSFEEIEAWQSARALSRLVYRLSGTGAFAKDFGMKDQMRRSSVSTLSNIAVGFESRTQPLFIDFLGRAKGSAGELRAQAYVALDANYISESEFQELVNLCKKCSGQISRFMAYLKKQPDRSRVQEENITYDFDGES